MRMHMPHWDWRGMCGRFLGFCRKVDKGLRKREDERPPHFSERWH